MSLKENRGLTLVESLVSIALIGAFLCSFLGVFFISRFSTERARHRMTAMNIVREYMEKEMDAGYSGGYSGETDYDYYATVNSTDPLNATPAVTITDPVDGKVYTLKPVPYYPNNAYENYQAEKLLKYESRNYKIVGFVVTWRENVFGADVGPELSERATAYIFDHG